MKRYEETADDGRKVVTVIPDDCLNLAGDGFGPSLIGLPMVKLSIFSETIGGSEDDSIERKVIGSIQVPTVAFLEMADKIRAALGSNPDAVDHYFEQVKSRLSVKQEE